MREEEMTAVKKQFSFPSAAGGCSIEAVRWLPADGNVRAVMQIGHGMLEHIGRYDAFAEYFVRHGFAVYGSTHLGHGMSINREYPRGYFGKNNRDGAIFLKDLKQMMDIARTEHPDVPYVYFGYSMGTFLGRMLLAEFGEEIDAAVLCSTGIPDLSMKAMIRMLRLLPSFMEKKPAPALCNMVFKKYNARTEKRTNRDWLSADPDYVDASFQDRKLDFYFTYLSFRDILTLYVASVDPKVFEKTRTDMPILFLSGEQDPVGNYGKGVRKVVRQYRTSGHDRVEMKLYPGRRHEIHLEPTGPEIWKEAEAFLERSIPEAFCK